jgi:hypothetical protein
MATESSLARIVALRASGRRESGAGCESSSAVCGLDSGRAWEASSKAKRIRLLILPGEIN